MAKKEKSKNNLYINLISVGKWEGDQVVSFLDFSSLDATISTVFKILGVVCFIKLVRCKKNK